ncbi:MAG: helix-turn-helix domain-containing protein [Oscillospiraceae bacterium]|nr:helix-turn-helix domain-containing protein [Oscillospiraceae bacterium]
MEQIVPKNTVGKRTYSVDEIRAILNISRRKAYELCNSGSFKIVRVGRTIRVSKLSFDEWLDNIDNNNGGI